MTTKNSVVKIQNLVVNHESRPVISSPAHLVLIEYSLFSYLIPSNGVCGYPVMMYIYNLIEIAIMVGKLACIRYSLKTLYVFIL